MHIISTLLIDVIILVFPLIANLIYIAHSRNVHKESSNTFLDFALVSSTYLFYEHCLLSNKMILISLVNIPLFIAFINKRDFISIFITVILMHIYHIVCNIPYLILSIEFLTYYIIYFSTYRCKNRNNLIVSLFVLDKTIVTLIMLCVQNVDKERTINIIFLLLVFILLTNLVLRIFKMSDDIIKLNMSISELEHEKQIRDSLFKITHEIKNPIAVCKTYLDMFDFKNKKHEKYIPIIKEEIDKTLYLLQDFLAMNRIKLNKEILDINMLLEDVSSQFEMVMKSKNIVFTHEINDDEVFVEGDYNRLNQVLTNVIKNAIEAIDINKLPYVSLYTEVYADKIKIIITDNGVGMSRQQLNRIKEPFYTTKKNGSGLGVSLSYNIMEAHGGSIEYDSKEYCGTKVQLVLPLANIS